jgi:hypothetical protein
MAKTIQTGNSYDSCYRIMHNFESSIKLLNYKTILYHNYLFFKYNINILFLNLIVQYKNRLYSLSMPNFWLNVHK